MLLLDFWGLPHEERLAFFCQIASQANEQEASAILHVFLDNCTTQTFMQIWEALQQSPQFQKMIREAKLQLEPATVDGRVIPTKDTAESEKEKAAPLIEPTDVEKPLVWRGSQRGVRKRGRRSTRFVDLSGITEAFDFKENGGDSSDENDDDFKESLGDSKHDKHRFQKFTIRDNVREDVEAMGLLLGKLSKFVRSLAPLVDNEDAAPSNVSASDDVLTIMDLATKLENAGALVEAPAGGGGGKRRLSLAADRELPILLAVQSLARSNNFDLVSQLIGSAVKAKMARVRLAAAEAKANDEDESDDDETVATEGDEEAMRIVTNLRRPSTKAAHMHEAKDQMHEQMQSGGGQNAAGESDATFVAALRAGKGDIPINTKSAAALRGVKLFNVDILLRIVNQLYRDNYEGMVSTLQYGNRRMEFSEFIYDWHIRKYGLKTLAQRHLLKLIQSLRKHEKKSFQCQLYVA
ncbi:hypothetical protein JG687_00002752 [Phytophthora cactorum]|uniref:Uncharacterized protein n=1 Tax=Phytophthora cactorum TaxID=29920 RepID=A0A8T1UWD7_9STRA|nr:hypothetical protein JG687_00002752 [Phytophthora cactorum]